MFKRIWKWLVKGDEYYDVAFSYAGKDRDKVEPVVTEVEKTYPKVYYDKHREVEDWGTELPEKLPEIYSDRGQFCVIFVSHHYAESKWTKLELDHALKRAARQNREYLLLARIDGTQLDGVSPNMKYVDAVPAEKLAEKIVLKIRRFRLQQYRVIAISLIAALAILIPSGLYISKLIRPAPAIRLQGVNENILRAGVTNTSSKPTEVAVFGLLFEHLPIKKAVLTLVDETAKREIPPDGRIELDLTVSRLETEYNEAASRRFVQADIEKLLDEGSVRLEVAMRDPNDPSPKFTLLSEPMPARRIAPFILNRVPDDVPRNVR